MKRLAPEVSGALCASYTIPTLESAITELVLNSIDAGASKVSVSLNTGTLSFDVRDDGAGIHPDDMPLLFEQNATSKCSSLDTMSSAVTQGFRGTALASIARCSLAVEVTSRHAQSARAVTCTCRRGLRVDNPPQADPSRSTGTSVVVQDLFHLVPVRRRATQEAGDAAVMSRVRGALECVAVAHPAVSVALYDAASGTRVLGTRRRESMLGTFCDLHGSHLAKEMRALEAVEHPEYSFTGWDLQYFYVNKRVIPYSRFHRVINTLFREVFFREDRRLSSFGSTYSCKDKTPAPLALDQPLDVLINKWGETVVEAREDDTESPLCDDVLRLEGIRGLSAARVVSKEELSTMEVLGQVDKKFIIARAGGVLYAFDQHAAHERVKLEELENALLGADGSERQFTKQACEWRYEATSHEAALLQRFSAVVSSWGFECAVQKRRDVCRTNEWIIVGWRAPVFSGTSLGPRDLVEFLGCLDSSGGSALTKPPAIGRILAHKACRNAIKFGDKLGLADCKELLQMVSRCRTPFQCAHGRPNVFPIVDMVRLSEVLSLKDNKGGGQ
eukprot:m51a1_g10548 putative dna mismatch repair protein (559) ;mRNA; f:30890-33562